MNLKSKESSRQNGNLATRTAVISLQRILQVLHLNCILKSIVEIIEIGRVLEYLKERREKREAGKIGMQEVK